MKRFAALYRRARRQHRHRRQGGRAAALLRRRPRRPMRPGRCTSWPAASRARWCPPRCCARWPASAPASTTGCSRSATRPSATWPRPSRTCCRRPPRQQRRSAWPTGSSSACCRCAAPTRPSRPQRIARVAGTSSTRAGRFLLVKLIGGGFRVGVSKLLVQRALRRHAGLDAKLVAQRMMGYTDAQAPPDAARYARAGGAERRRRRAEAGQPYPFFLAHALRRAAGRVRRSAWARRPTGWWSGSTTASAPSWSSARARCGSGRAAKSW